MPRTARDVVFVDGVRTPFGKAGATGLYAETRADDMVVSVIRELLRRNPALPPERIGEVAIAATTQTGDQGLTIGRSAAVLAGLPKSVPGYAIDRMCAGAMTAVTTAAGSIALGATDTAIAGGVEHMGHHPMGSGVDPNPRFISERLVDPSALVMGSTAENLHDRFPAITRDRADAYALASQRKVAAAYAAGQIQPDLVPVAVRSAERGWGLATADEPPRPDTTLAALAGLKTPFRPHGRVTAGNSAGLNDGATGCVIAAQDVAAELGLDARMRLVDFSFAGVDPEVMGIGPVPATEAVLARNDLTIDDIGLIEINEAFAVQVLAFLDHFKIADEDPRVNPWGGAIALGHPLASSGVRLMIQLARAVRRPARRPLRPDHDVRRAGHGRHRLVGEPQCLKSSEPNDPALDSSLITALFPGEVVTRAYVRDVELPYGAGTMALITLDNGRDHTRPNTFGPAGLISLREALDAVAARATPEAGEQRIAAVGVTGKPFIFAVGADLTGAALVGSRDEALAIGRLGHSVFRRLGELGVPSFAFVNGAALGGGLELALHCSYRTISSGVTAVAFPECFLGLLPGWGGTYLLPHLIGPANALKVIVENPLSQNRMLSGSQAFSLGIADVMFSPADFLAESLRWAALRGERHGERSAGAAPQAPWDPPRNGIRRSPRRGSSWTASCTARPPRPTGPSTWWPRPAAGPATRGSLLKTKGSRTCCSARSCGPGSMRST